MPAIDQKDVVHSEATYLITSGTGGVGRPIDGWLPSQGLKTIALGSRSGISQSSTLELIDELKEHWVKVVVYTYDNDQVSQAEK